MKKYILTVVFIFFTTILFSQSNEEYELLNQAIPSLLNIKTNDTIIIDELQAEFKDQEVFFSKAFLESYTYRVAGVDSKKVKKLIRSLDFDYLAKQKHSISRWDFNRLNFRITSDLKKDIVQKQYQIAQVIFTKDRKMAFIYYMEKVSVNDYLDSGSLTVKIYKKKKGKWVLDNQIPIWFT